ncbi:MAG: hypothetical protein J0H82_31635 [Alphaproteobacteria bacterium]|jgi:hypothetical protein|nr:hypothetical protein [Alphaproteobacteria bacterium]
MRGAIPALLVLLAAGCAGPSQFDAYVIPAGNGMTSKSQISICYSSALNAPEDIRALVAQDCEEPKLTVNERNLGVCPLATPSLATYTCARVNPDLLGQRAPMPLRPLKN